MHQKVKSALDILRKFEVPRAQQNERSALTLLALTDTRKRSEWHNAKRRFIRIHEILQFCAERYGVTYAENTRETIRRQTLHQFIQAVLVEINADDPSRPTNSPKTVYSISIEALDVIKSFGTDSWDEALADFKEQQGTLIERYRRERELQKVEIQIDGLELKLSPGEHNELQAKIIEILQPNFFPNSRLLYIGDTAKKTLHIVEKAFEKLSIPLSKHDKLPDVIFYEEERNILYLIEAVTSHGPVSPKRWIELEEFFSECSSYRIYISAFPSKRVFKEFIEDIAWETDVWILEDPSHMIHFNGPKFLTVVDTPTKA